MAESEVRVKTVKEYEQKLVDMEKRYQEKMREEVSNVSFQSFVVSDTLLTSFSFQADHAQTKLNAKLDILTRLYESRAAAAASAASAVSPSNYDDSDEENEEEEQEDSRETDDASADVEALLLNDKSMLAEVSIVFCFVFFFFV